MANLTGVQLVVAFRLVNRAQVGADRYADKCLDAVDAQLSEFLKIQRTLEGEERAEISRERHEYDFSPESLYGLKIAFAQALTGSPTREPATHEEKRVILAIAERIGKKFTAAVRKAANLDDEVRKPADAELDLKD